MDTYEENRYTETDDGWESPFEEEAAAMREDWYDQWWQYVADYSDGNIDYEEVMRYAE